MRNNYIYACLSLIVSISFALYAALPVRAATLPTWQWSDISSLVPIQTNRPVWALAYAGSNWIGTDGQDMNISGRLWKTDGTNAMDLTIQAKNAGISRVDFLVSDGKTTLLIQNPGQLNTVIVSYDQDFRNRTSEIMSYFTYNETIAAIAGKNASWLILGSKGTLLEWNSQLGTMTSRQTFTQNASNRLPQAALRFQIPQNKSDRAQTTILPMLKGWMIILPSNENVPQNQYFFYNDGIATEISNTFPGLGTLSASASNGTHAIMIGTDRSMPWNIVGYTYDGTNIVGISNFDVAGLHRTAWIDAQLAWTGTSWTVFAGKNGYRIQDSILTTTGKSHDYFVTMASNNSGTVLVGGAVSHINSATPQFPLKAKLVKLVEAAPAFINTSTWTWVEPSFSQLYRDQYTTYNVGAWSIYGMKSIEIRANGNPVQFCNIYNSQGNQLCTITIRGESYAANGLVTLQGIATDSRDNRVATPETALSISSRR